MAAGEIVRFRRYSVAELLAERREFEWLAVGMLVDGTYGVDAGELKSLKSYLGLARAVGLAAGVPVLGRWRAPSSGGSSCSSPRADGRRLLGGSSGSVRRTGSPLATSTAGSR